MVPPPMLAPALLVLAAAVTTDDTAAAAAPASPGDRPYRVDHRLKVRDWAVEMLDPAVYRVPPHSLHLNASAHEGTYSFTDVPVRGGVKYRLRFWYLAAAGTVGTVTARVSQYEDRGHAWRALAGAHVVPMPVVGRWQLVEYDFRALPDATECTVRFAIESLCDVGDCWVSEPSLAPAGLPIVVGP